MVFASKSLASAVLAFGWAALSASCQMLPSGQSNPIEGMDVGGEKLFVDASRSGNIHRSERWSGTIEITGDILIRPGGAITIEPGTTVRFAAGSDDQHSGGVTSITDPNFPRDPEIIPSKLSTINLLGGDLHAVGTADSPITFTSAAGFPRSPDWHGLGYGHEDSVMNLQYSVIEYSFIGIGVVSPTDDRKMTIENNIIRHTIGCCLCVNSQPVPVQFTVSGNDLSDCGHEAIDIHENINLIIENNIIHDNRGSWGDKNSGGGGLTIIDGNSAVVRGNTFLRNGAAINVVSDDNNPVIEGNTFIDNGQNCIGYCP